MADEWNESCAWAQTNWGEQRVTIGPVLINRILRYFLPYWRRALVVFACLAATAGLGLAPALVTRSLVDILTHPDASVGRLALILGIGVAAALAGGLVGVLQSYLSTSISQGIMFDLREQLFGRFMRQSVGFYTSSRTGDLQSRMNNDIGGIQDVISNTVFGLVSSIITALTTLALMLALDWRLTLGSLLVMPLALVPSRFLGQANYRARKRLQERLAETSAYLGEVLGISGILLVKAFTKERQERRRFHGLNDDIRQLSIQQSMIQRWFGMLGGTLMVLSPALLMFLGGYLVITGGTSLGTVVSIVTILVSRLASSASMLGTVQVDVLGSLALFERIFHSLDEPADVADRPGACSLTAVRGAVAFRDVTFTYPGTARPVLHDVSFEIEPGQLVALVGPSGAGKTTTTYLVSRFYDPAQGAVCVDGVDLRDATQESLSAHLGIVFQDTFLFHASVRENLLYARPDATPQDLERAARAAHIHDFVAGLPDGYDTVVGERGHRLSGGEKQRIAIARVILKDPRVVILDEATSNLDSVSEHLIQAALRPLFAGRTSIVIAHRLSTVLAADCILVLDQGRLVDRGTHHELLQRQGLYRSLYERQFRTEPDNPSPLAGEVAAPAAGGGSR
jgi:ATP-binding cassette subfamily B protein